MKALDSTSLGIEIHTEEEAAKSVNYAYGLIITAALIIMFGMTMLYSTSYGWSVGAKYFYAQLIWGGIGLAAALGTVMIGFKKLSDLSLWLILIVSILLIACLFFPEINGARRWIRVGGLSLQPSELAKPVLALFMAKYCAENFRSINQVFNRHGALPMVAVCGVVMLLVVAGKDLGTTLLLAMVLLVVLFVAGISLRWFIFPAIGAVGLFFFIKHFNQVRWVRITSFLEPERYASDDGYQLWNSLLALGSGKWFGVGFMESRLKARYLPEAHTDFILAIVGEELGLLSLIAICVAYLVFAYFGMKIALNARTRQGLFLGVALTATIVLQAAINIGVVSGAMPTKGIPAPMISYGGSNLLMSMIATGLLVSIALDTALPGFNAEIMEWVKTRLTRRKKA